MEGVGREARSDFLPYDSSYSLKSRSWQDRFLSEVLREKLFPAILLVPGAASTLWPPLACKPNHSNFCFFFALISLRFSSLSVSLSISLSLSNGHLPLDLGSHPKSRMISSQEIYLGDICKDSF